jgi:hypothetical protein
MIDIVYSYVYTLIVKGGKNIIHTKSSMSKITRDNSRVGQMRCRKPLILHICNAATIHKFTIRKDIEKIDRLIVTTWSHNKINANTIGTSD